MAWLPKVGRHVQVEVSGDTKLRPGIITAYSAPNMTVRVGHQGQVLTLQQQVKPKSSRVT